MNIYEVKKIIDEGGVVVVYDIETTGLKKADSRILSFSAIKIVKDGDSFKEIDRRDIFINPGCHIPEEVSAINHITDEAVKDCPTENECCEEILSFLNSADIVTGYNSVTFDDWFINEMSRRVTGKKWVPKAEIDTMSLAKDKLKKGVDVSSHKLCDITEYFNAGEGLEFHNSIDDVIATARVFWKLKEMYELPKPICAAIWEKYGLKRLYIDNTEGLSVYYDIVNKEWSRDPSIDVAFINEVLKPFGSVDELIALVEKQEEKILAFNTEKENSKPETCELVF